VRQRAKERKQEKFTALLHHLTVSRLRESYFALKRKAAPGVDEETWHHYGVGLEDRLVDLHSRIHRGAYQAKPSLRAYILKADGRQRPLGIAAAEDKIVQQAAVTILNQIYEVDFRAFRMGTAAAGKRVPAPRLRPLGGSMATESGTRASDSCPLRGRSGNGVSV